MACLNGNLEMLKYLHKHNFKIGRNTSIGAIIGKSMECLEYLNQNHFDVFSTYHLNAAAIFGNIDYVNFMINQPFISIGNNKNNIYREFRKHYEYDSFSTTKYSIEYNQLDFYITIFPIFGETNSDGCIACQYGSLEILKFLKKQSDLDKDTIWYGNGYYSDASSNGQLEILKYLHSIKYNMYCNAVELAAENGYFDCLKYLIEKNYNYNIDECIELSKNSQEIINFLNTLKE